MVKHGFYFTYKENKEKRPFFNKEDKRRLYLLPLFSLFLSLLLSEPPAMLMMALSAVLLHECGHVIVFFLLTRSLPSLKAEKFGLRLMPARPLLFQEELFAALGGPLFNLLLGIFFCRVGTNFFFSMGAMHFLFAFFNLLPFDGSDGGRVFHLLFLRLLPKKKARAASLFLSGASLAFFYFVSLFTFYFTGEGLSGVFFSVFSFPWHYLDGVNDF